MARPEDSFERHLVALQCTHQLAPQLVQRRAAAAYALSRHGTQCTQPRLLARCAAQERRLSFSLSPSLSAAAVAG